MNRGVQEVRRQPPLARHLSSGPLEELPYSFNALHVCEATQF